MMPIRKTITDPAAWALDVESRMPAAQMIRLQMEQTGARNDKKNDPHDSPRHPQTRVKQFHYPEAKKNCCQEIRGSADQLIADSRDNCTERPDEILRGMICRRATAEPNPGWHVLRRVGNQREKEQCPDEEENESEDFVPGAIFFHAGHRV